MKRSLPKYDKRQYNNMGFKCQSQVCGWCFRKELSICLCKYIYIYGEYEVKMTVWVLVLCPCDIPTVISEWVLICDNANS